MTMIDVFTGMSPDGAPMFRREHPFNVFGNRRHRDYGDTVYVLNSGRMKHQRVIVQRHPVVEVSRRTGLPRTVHSTIEAAPANTRQGRRARARYNQKWTRISG